MTGPEWVYAPTSPECPHCGSGNTRHVVAVQVSGETRSIDQPFAMCGDCCLTWEPVTPVTSCDRP